MQPMPVLDRMLRASHNVPPDDLVAAWSAVKVRADVASEMYWQSPKEHWYRDRDYPPMRLPYPAMWIEWSQPYEWNSIGKTVYAKGKMREFGPPLAALLSEVGIPPNRKLELSMLGSLPETVTFPHAADTAFTVAPYALRDGKLITFPAAIIVMLDTQGMQIREPMYCIPGDPQDSQATMSVLHSLWAPSLLAIGLMNCKNVTTNLDSISIGPKVNRRHPKRDEIQYRTIVVPGHSGVGSSTGLDRPVAMHRVRGHFKTFTADAPLLGKHTGTYWWGWQVRGKADNGVVVSDYKLGAPV